MPFLWFRRKQPPPTLVLDPEEAQYIRQGGRRHLAALPYPLPKDLEEVGRLDFHSSIMCCEPVSVGTTVRRCPLPRQFWT
jgi:hypothetical protein